MAHLGGDEFGGVGVDHVVDLQHLSLLHQQADDVNGALGHAVGQFLDGDRLGQHHLAQHLLARTGLLAAPFLLAPTLQRCERTGPLTLFAGEGSGNRQAPLATIVLAGLLDRCRYWHARLLGREQLAARVFLVVVAGDLAARSSNLGGGTRRTGGSRLLLGNGSLRSDDRLGRLRRHDFGRRRLGTGFFLGLEASFLDGAGGGLFGLALGALFFLDLAASLFLGAALRLFLGALAGFGLASDGFGERSLAGLDLVLAERAQNHAAGCRPALFARRGGGGVAARLQALGDRLLKLRGLRRLPAFERPAFAVLARLLGLHHDGLRPAMAEALLDRSLLNGAPGKGQRLLGRHGRALVVGVLRIAHAVLYPRGPPRRLSKAAQWPIVLANLRKGPLSSPCPALRPCNGPALQRISGSWCSPHRRAEQHVSHLRRPMPNPFRSRRRFRR